MKFATAIVPLLFGALALALGQDGNWDLRNYHWYNAYAFINDRLMFDVGAAQPATYYNPLLDLPFYWLATHTPARVAGFVLGFVQGLNFILLYFIAARVQPALRGRSRTVTAVVIATVGVIGGGNLGLVGTTYNDNLVSLLVLGALLIVITVGPARDPSTNSDERPWALPLAGFIVGCGVGLKLPTQIYAVGLCIALLFLRETPLQRIRHSFVFGCGVLGGIVVAGGPWFVRLWLDFGNPLFPYFNQFIHSPMGLPESYRDTRFLPHGFWRTLTFPLVFSRYPLTVGESVFRDYRILVAFLAILAFAAVRIVRLRPHVPAAAPLDPAARYVIAAFVISYCFWLQMFAIYRYAIALEMLAPVVFVVAIGALPMRPQYRSALAGILLVAVTVTARPGDWGRLPWPTEYRGPFVNVVAPPLPRADDTMIVMTGTTPTAFVIPAFAPQIPFLRIDSYLVHPADGPIGLNRIMASRIGAHRGDLYWVVAEWEREAGLDALHAYGLTADLARCEAIDNNLASGIELCPLSR